jgi:hypothetical protein
MNENTNFNMDITYVEYGTITCPLVFIKSCIDEKYNEKKALLLKMNEVKSHHKKAVGVKTNFKEQPYSINKFVFEKEKLKVKLDLECEIKKLNSNLVLINKMIEKVKNVSIDREEAKVFICALVQQLNDRAFSINNKIEETNSLLKKSEEQSFDEWKLIRLKKLNEDIVYFEEIIEDLRNKIDKCYIPEWIAKFELELYDIMRKEYNI